MNDQFIGSYRILDKIGAGGMATVYLAVHQDIPNLRVVIKLLSDPRMVERFRAEADKLALLDGNPHICQIKHFFNHGEDFAIAMEFIDGITLDDLVKDQGQMTVDNAVQIIMDVLQTLQIAHEHGISHRDIKPSNLMVAKNQQVKIIDFGIAKSESDPNLTVAGSSCGTPAYMAPEQFNPTESTNYILADIYAVGTTLYYLLTGKLPFKGDNAFALRDAKLFSDPARPRELNKDISAGLEEVILKALAKEPEDRYSSASEMRKALLKAVGSPHTTAIEIPDKPIVSPGVKIPKSGRKPLPFILIGALVVLVAAYFIFFSRGPSAPDAPILTGPADGTELDTSNPILSWGASAGEGGFYDLIYADNSEFIDPVTLGGLTASEYAVKRPLEPGTYFWKVRAMNKNRQRSEFSSVYSFSVPVLESLTPQADLEINISPRGNLYLNDELKGQNISEMSFRLDTGEYLVRVENSTSLQKSFADTLRLTPDESLNKNYRFTFAQADPKPPEEEFGYLRIGSRPILGASITIDGERQPNVTPYRFKLKAGRHIITAYLEVDGQMRGLTDTLSVAPGGDEKYLFDFNK